MCKYKDQYEAEPLSNYHSLPRALEFIVLFAISLRDAPSEIQSKKCLKLTSNTTYPGFEHFFVADSGEVLSLCPYVYF